MSANYIRLKRGSTLNTGCVALDWLKSILNLHCKRLLAPNSRITLSQENYCFILNTVKIVQITLCIQSKCL